MSNPLILALDVGGVPNRWINWQDAVTYHAKELVEWSLGKASFTFHGGESALTGTTSEITTASIIAVKGKTKTRNMYKAPALTNRALFRRDQYMCAYCSNAFASELDLTRDHIHPVSKGGKDEWNNVVTACRRCNHKKSDNLLKDIDMELNYLPYTPCRYEWLILTNRKILPGQQKFLVSNIKNEKSRYFNAAQELDDDL